MGLLSKVKKKIKKVAKSKAPKPKKTVVDLALEEIREIVGKVKKDSHSDFENLKREIELMLLQPEKF